MSPNNTARRATSLGFDPQPYPGGVHMCFIFDDEQERRRIMSRYIESGLRSGEQVAYFVDTMSPEEFRGHLAQMGLEPPPRDDRRLLVSAAQATYCPDGCFRVERMLQTLQDARAQSCLEHFPGLRVAGEMNWALRGLPGSDRLIEYESKVNRVLWQTGVTAICQYDARLFDGATLYRLLKVHPLMIVKGQVVKNPYYLESA